MRRWVNLTILGLFFLMVIVDGSIVTIAIPALAHGLHVGTERVNLVISIYLVTISALLLPFGQLGAQVGRERLFQAGTLAFLLGSWLAGAGQTLAWVLLGRVVQGVGASMTMANSYALVSDWFPPAQLGRAFGIESIFISLGGLAGPGLGGLILARWNWRYLFWLNLPIGVLCLAAAAVLFPRPRRQPVQLDLGGSALLLGLAASFYLGTAQLLTAPAWAAVSLVVCAGLGMAFWAWEKRAAHPLLDFALLASAAFRWPLLAAFTTFVAAYFFTLLGPIYLQLVVHLGPAATGAVLMGGPLLAVVANPVAGVLADHWAQTRVMRVGMGLLVASTVGLLLLSNMLEPWLLLAVSLVMAAGTSLFGTANSAYLMRHVSAAQRGAAGALNALLREVGLVLGATLTSTSFYGGLSVLTGRLVTSATGQLTEHLLLAQRLSYTLAAALLFWGWHFLRLLNRQETNP